MIDQDEIRLIVDMAALEVTSPEDCDKVKQYVVETLLCVGDGSIELDADIQTQFPQQWAEAQDIINPPYNPQVTIQIGGSGSLLQVIDALQTLIGNLQETVDHDDTEDELTMRGMVEFEDHILITTLTAGNDNEAYEED